MSKIAVLVPGIGYTCDRPLLYFAGNCLCRAVPCALGTSFTFFRINLISQQVLTDMGAALFIDDVLLKFLRETVHRADDRLRRTLSESAECCAFNHVRKFSQFIQIGHLSFSVDDSLHDF